MTNYRIVARHVRYWRGIVHKWSNVYPFTGTLSSGDYGTALGHIHDAEQSVCYPAPGAAGGGIWETALYNQASGGVPVAVATYFDYFDPDTVGDWIPYDGDAWEFTTDELLSAAEAALSVRWAAGLSSSGKPVFFRKWFHAVPVNPSSPPAPDVTSTNRTSIATILTVHLNAIGGLGAPMGNGGRLASSTPLVDQFFGAHQMPRGRRRPPTRIMSGVVGLPPGLLIVPGSDGSLD
jgi:hypothetical protein